MILCSNAVWNYIFQHGTCPICRKYLADDGLSSINSDPLGISLGVGPNLAALIRFVWCILITI